MTQGTKTMLKPLGNRVLAKRLEQDDSMKGGIIIPDSAKQKQEVMEVIAIGEGKKTDEGQTLPMPVKIGEKILIDKYAGQEVTLEDEEYTILKADDMIAIIEQ